MKIFSKKLLIISFLAILIIGVSACDMIDTGIEDGILEITSIPSLSSEVVEYGTSFEDIDLPEDVEVTLDDNSTTSLDVNWLEEDYDGETADTYTIVGELELTNNIINPDDFYPTVQVTVQEEGITLYTVTVNYDDNKGTVTGSGDFKEGEQVELSAEANPGYEFVEWTGYINSEDPTITFEIPAEDVELNAVFKLKEEAFKIVKLESPPSKNVEFGTSFEDIDLPEEIEVTLDDNSTKMLEVNWKEGDYDSEKLGTYKIDGELELKENITNPDNLTPTIEIEVKEPVYRVNVDYAYREGEVSGYGDFKEGEIVELTAEANPGYEFIRWTGYKDSDDTKVTFTMPAGDVDFGIEFKRKPGNFNVKNVQVSPQEVLQGETINVTAEIENTDEEEGLQNIELIISHEDEGEQITKIKEYVLLQGSETKVIEFTNISITSNLPIGDYTLEVKTENDSDSTNLKVLEPAFFEVTKLDIPEEIELGETVEIEAEIKNTGGSEGTQNIEIKIYLQIIGWLLIEEQTIEVTLEPDETWTFSEEVEVPDEDEVDYNLSGSNGRLELITEDDDEVVYFSIK